MGSELSSADKLTLIYDGMKGVSLYKNEQYGDSALKPIGAFAVDLPAESLIRVRLDDKLSRIKNRQLAGLSPRKNDYADTIGYLVLFCASQGWLDFEDLKD